MIYTKKCPYCGTIVGSGHGDPVKYLGSALDQCTECRKLFVDKDMIEWAISPWYRKLGYCFANNRIWLCFFPPLLLLASTESWLVCVISFVIIFAICCLYVNSQLTVEREVSKERVQNQEYIALLIAAGYPMKRIKK